ncbi:hypothetical protein MNBD_BACTEROID02-985, partial [hydrothermal vent metagenome]
MKLAPMFLVSTFIGILLFFNFPNNLDTKEINKDKWVKLFNGKDLKDWHVKIRGYPLDVNYKNTFRVTDGVIQVNYDQYDDFNESYGHIFYKNEFSNYKLRLQYRFTGKQLKDGAGWAKRNSGIMIHCQPPESMGLN